MEFQKVLTLAGPNIWAKFPVLEAWVELGDLKDSPSNEMPGFNDRVMCWLPLMIEHRCSIGERGGFFERLRRGTYLAHILEHVTLELQSLAGATFGYGRARETLKEGLFRVAVEYDHEQLGRACLEAGRQLCLAAVYDRPFDVSDEVRKLRALADEVCLGPSTRAIVDVAEARKIPVVRLTSGSLVQLGYGAKARRILTAETDRTGAIAETIAQDKDLTRALLRQVSVPVPVGRLVKDAADAWAAAMEIGVPVVVKPQFGNHARGVVLGVSTREEIEAGFRFAALNGASIMVEQFAQGAEHRLLIVDGKLVAAARGNPAEVVGDGRQTIAELIESQLNSDPRRGKELAFPLAIIEVTPPVLLVLEQQGYTVDSVPAKGQQVMIQRNGNLAIDVTDEVHPDFARMAVLAARTVGLDVAGIDVIADDISRPLEQQGAAVIEVNAGPGLQMHVEPESGKPRPVGEAIMDTLFAAGETGRIPVVCVTGAERTTAVTRLLAHLLAGSGRTLGVASAEGITVGGNRIHTGDCRGGEHARGMLINPLVEVALFESSPETIVSEGVCFQYCDVVVVTSMGEGILLDLAEGDTPEKKSLVYRGPGDIVTPQGAIVLKAGEPLGPIVAGHAKGRLVLFSTDAMHPEIEEHRSTGGCAVFPRDGAIVLSVGTQETALAKMPKLAFDETTLAAVAGAWALTPENHQIIANALATFSKQA